MCADAWPEPAIARQPIKACAFPRSRYPGSRDVPGVASTRYRDMRWILAVQGGTWECDMTNDHPRAPNSARSGARRTAGVLLTLVVAAGAVTLLSACNTTSGLGKDVSATGRAVTDSAERVKEGL
jgi:entericidin B